MTVIVGLKTQNSLIMGCDSGTFHGETKVIYDKDKVFIKDNFMVGLAGNPRVSQLLEHVFNPPDHDPRMSTYHYMVKEFVPAFISMLENNGGLTIDKNVKEYESYILVAYKDNIFGINQAFHVSSGEEYICTGHGFNFAYASLYSTKGFVSPEDRVRVAVEAACKFDAYCQGPSKIFTLPREG